VRLHQEAAFRLAFLLLGDAAEAEDAVQDALVSAFRGLARFDETRPFRPWLVRIAANQAKNRLRSLARRLARLERMARRDPEWVHGATPAEAAPPSPPDAPAELWRAVRRLGEADQEVIYLRFYLGLNEAETAASLQVATGTVKSRLHRALSRLRAVVQVEFPFLKESLAE
jgi:RNA polymerase sigma-70 factor (ECF subfamily)